MPLSSQIRKMRKERGLTQEQVAASLGVSAPAVNKWEKGVTCPDITLLPPLARLLDTDVNTLLCFHETLSEHEIGVFCNELAAAAEKEGIEKAFQLAQQKMHRYPRCGALLHSAALFLDGALAMADVSPQNRQRYEKQLLSFYERAAQSEDGPLRDSAVSMLASKYIAQDDYENAQRMLDMLPEGTAVEKKQLQAGLFIRQGQYAEAAALLEHRLITLSAEIQQSLLRLAKIAIYEERASDADALTDIYVQCSRLFHQWPGSSWTALFEAAAAEKNAPKALLALEETFKALSEPFNMLDSPLYRHIPMKKDAPQEGVSFPQMLPPLLRELEQSEEYAFLRGSREFEELLTRWRQRPAP